MKPFDCSACALGQVGPGAGLPAVPGEGPLDAEIVIVASHPGIEDQELQRPLSGSLGVSVVNSALFRAGIDRSKVYVTYLVKHMLKTGQSAPYGGQIKACKQFLDMELDALTNKKVIILMGAKPVAEVIGYGSVDGLRGRPLAWAKDPSVTIMPTFSPGSFAYSPNPNKVKMFESDLRKARDIAAGESVSSGTDVTVVRTMNDFSGLLEDISSHAIPQVAADLETTGLSPRLDQITDLAFSAKTGTAYIVPIVEWVGDQFRAVASDEVIAFGRALLADSGIQKIWHNGLFDYSFLVEKGWVNYDDIWEQFLLDTMCFHYATIDESPPHGLEFLAGAYTNMMAWDFEKLAFEAIHGKGSLYRMPFEQRAIYAGGDVDATWRLRELLPAIAEAAFSGSDRDPMDVYNTIMKPMLPGIIEMQVTGVALDLDALNETRAVYLKELRKAEQAVWDCMGDGDDWNIGSVDQVYERMTRCLSFKWAPVSTHARLWTKTRVRPSLSASTGARDEWSEMYPHDIWDKYSRFTMLFKLVNTYTGKSETDFSDKSLPASVCPTTGRIHTSIRPTVTATSRRSSSNPNLQNIPIRTPEGSLLRRCFVATEGYSFVVPDYDSAEVWVAAHISGDELMKALVNDPEVSIHKHNASIFFDMPLDEIGDKSPQKNAAKIFLFGTFYGGQPKSLARKMSKDGIHVTEADVQQMHARFMDQYVDFAAWQQNEIAKVIRDGWNETTQGFRRHYVWPSEPRRQHEIIRQLGNHPIQGTVAGHVAGAYRRVQVALRTGIVDDILYREGGFDGSLVLEVHDELMAEVKDDQASLFLDAMIHAMTYPVVGIGKPIPVSGDIRKRWLAEDD